MVVFELGTPFAKPLTPPSHRRSHFLRCPQGTTGEGRRLARLQGLLEGHRAGGGGEAELADPQGHVSKREHLLPSVSSGAMPTSSFLSSNWGSWEGITESCKNT